ncbi:Na/Pi cotransporter family protein [Ancylobacter sonchi]|uniref:Na/Pi cotransporter family protein n=1 Tax=Ancylobacter sonchi TaxID=1937790 RepID=UPI001BD36501|nr:Na/Pi symporter [Ancylobacter sonchi]MBS7533463.1 Na/Pi cotransporter family protein [Ancylobacter sonchi]
MSTAIAILGGVGLFLLGMTVMTDGLKALAGSALRVVLGKAAATPASGAFWGAVVTLLVQSSSAVTMTTIGLVSAGLLTFPQGLGLVFGANIGTTGTGWLVALIGVRVSLSTYALPLIFIGALAKLLAGGRVAAAGAALAGFALVLYGLTTLQQGMGGLAETLQPSDLPVVLGMPGVGWAAGSVGLMTLIAIGLAMTAVMQSSTAAIAVTISAFFAGAVSLEQGAALIIGQNIGTATSSALAAIGASATAKRLALAYVLFKVIAALIAIVAFPFTTALMNAFTGSVDGTTLLAAYHTAYNVVGVAVLLPATPWFTRIVERLLPSRETALQRALDPSALSSPVIAVETARRVVADMVATASASVSAGLSTGAGLAPEKGVAAIATLEEVRDFLSELKEQPGTEAERRRMTSTLHALDHAARLAEILASGSLASQPAGLVHDRRAAQLCNRAMQATQAIGNSITSETALSMQAAPIGWNPAPATITALAEVEEAARELGALQRDHRASTLASVAPGELTAADAFARIDAVLQLDRLAHHAWRATAHLLGRGEFDDQSMLSLRNGSAGG